MYEFAADVAKNIGQLGYENPEMMLSSKPRMAHNRRSMGQHVPVYIPIITFNSDSSEMGGWAFEINCGHFRPMVRHG